MEKEAKTSVDVLVLGGGESGMGAAILAHTLGQSVFLSDAGNLKPTHIEKMFQAGLNESHLEQGGHQQVWQLFPKVIVKSPGIPSEAEIVQHFVKLGVPVISEIEFAAPHTQARLIGITGSNGKTTTTLLTYHFMQASFGKEKVRLAGNIGDSFAYAVAQDLNTGLQPEWYVLELSSFQLDGVFKARFHIAMILNITPDHLDRYQYQFPLYAAAKFRIFIGQQTGDVAFLAPQWSAAVAEFQPTHTFPAKVSELCYSHQTVLEGHLSAGALNPNSGEIRLGNWVFQAEEYPVQGPHNWQNMAFALAAVKAAGAEELAVRKSFSTFQNAPHRLQPVAEVNGVRYVNDSKATNVDSTFYALQSFGQRPIVWIAGGKDKGNDYAPLFPLLEGRVKALVCMGKDNAPLLAAFQDKLPVVMDTHSLADALETARSLASEGDVVLLSPACASFDLFKNYEDRGYQFAAYVNDWLKEGGNS